jgi:Domain of unknown function (DUF4252)
MKLSAATLHRHGKQDSNQEKVMTKGTKMTKMTRTMQLVLVLTVAAASTANANQLKLKLKPKAQPDAAVASLAMQVANVSMSAAPQVKDDLFAGTDKFAQGASSVTEINLDPRTMGMVSHSSRDRSLASKMNFMVVHKYQYDKPGMYSMDDVEAYRKKLTDGSWACPIRVRSKTSSTDICSRTASDNETNEMVILTAQPRELTFIHMSGKMSLDELNRMSEGPDEIHLHTPPDPPEPKMKLYLAPSPAPSPSPTPKPPQ